MLEWHITTAQSLALIDQKIDRTLHTPAEYEIIRRVIYDTGDFDFQHLIRFSEKALTAGAAALAARSTIIVDVPMIQVGIVPSLQDSFANPVYCSAETITRPQKQKTKTAWGMQTLAQRYSEGIFVVGQSATALLALVELVEEELIKPALIIGTPAGLIGVDIAKERLQDTQIPFISIHGQKGSAVVAVAIVNGLIDLAWLAYGENGMGVA